MGIVNGVDYEEEIIFANVRHVMNTAFEGFVSTPVNIPAEPIPRFKQRQGFFATQSNNKKYGTGYIDFSKSDCTGGGKWKFKWLLGRSEFPTDTLSNGSWPGEQPPEPNNFFGSGSEWTMDKGDNGGSNHGKGFDTLFNNYDPAICISRSKVNGAHKFCWGYMDEPVWNDKGYVRISKGSHRNAHYTRAKGITFRYKTMCYENFALGDTATDDPATRGWHGHVPLWNFGLIFVKTNPSQDNFAYYAELISSNKERTCKDNEDHMGGTCFNSSDFNESRGRGSSYRHIIGRAHHKVDYVITAKEEIKDSEGVVVDTKFHRRMQDGPWDEIGPLRHDSYFYSYETLGEPPEVPVDGVCTLTLSKEACEHIWDNDMVCVGLMAQSTQTGRGMFFTGSTTAFQMYPPKILEQEYRGDNKIVFENTAPEPGEEVYSRVMNKPGHISEMYDFLEASRTGRKDVSVPIDVVL